MSGSIEWRYGMNLLSTEMIAKMGDEIVQLCDELEPFGLVDYELGLWEDEITCSKKLPIQYIFVLTSFPVVMMRCMEI